MQGVVKTFLPEKKYGFIKGDDGKDYFFHVRAFKDKQQVEKICEEIRVNFEQVATPKGYQAKQCILVNPSEEENFVIPDKILISRLDCMKGWEILERGDWIIHGTSEDSPDAAKKNLVCRAKEVGANAVLSVEYYKTTGSSGNYLYTVHNFKGRIATVAKRNSLGSLKKDDFCKINDKAKILRGFNSQVQLP